MKKSILLILILMMFLPLTSCGSKEEKCPDGMTCNNLDKWIGVEKTLDKDTYDGDVFFVGEDLEAGTYLLTNTMGDTQVLVYKNREAYESVVRFDRIKSKLNSVIGEYWALNQYDEVYVFLEEGNLAVFYGDRCDFTKYDPFSRGILYSGTYFVPTSISPGTYTLQCDVVEPGGGKQVWVDIFYEGVTVYLFENIEDYYNFVNDNEGSLINPDRDSILHYAVDEKFLSSKGATDTITLKDGMVIFVDDGSVKIVSN